MGELKDLIDGYVARHGSSYGTVGQKIGLSRTTVSGWFARGLTKPPSADVLRALAVQIQVPYSEVLDATLHEYGYLPEEGLGHGKRPAKKSPAPPTPIGNARTKRNTVEPVKRAARKTTKPKKK